MNDFEFFIRFGVHKDRETLKSLRGSMAGLVVPAHILCHSTNATIAAISYINKSFYIDPMTFLYAGSDIKDYVVKDKETNTDKFKPSIAKLTDDYGLTETFQSNGYTALQPDNFTEEFINNFCDKNLKLQLKKVDESKEGAYKKYGDLLSKIGENHIVQEMQTTHTPKGIVPPYFYFASLTDPWLDVNLKLAKSTKEKSGQDLVTPLVFTNSATLGTSLLDKFADYSQLFIWVDDLDEKKSNSREEQISKLKTLAEFIKEAKTRNKKIINICGSYYSIILGKLGLAGMCNGIFYGEFRAKKSKMGGAPQARYYIRDVHEFFGIPETIALLNKYPALQDKDSQKCLDLVADGKIDNIIAFSTEHALAQTHFVYTREKEIEVMEHSSLSDLRDDLQAKYTEWATKIPDPEITSKNIEYLSIWNEALNSFN